MNIENLEQLGLTKNEAKIYVSLLDLGESQAGQVSKKTQINRPATYDALDRLIEKGLVGYHIEAGKKVFKPSHPNIFLSQLKEKEDIANEIIPQLSQLFNSKKQKEESEVYKGRKGIKTILDDLLTYKQYVALGSSGKFLEIMKHDFVAFQNRKKELKIKSRIIQSESSRKNTELRKVSYAEFRYLPDTYAIPITIIVYGTNVAIMSWGDIPLATVLTSESVSESFQTYFEFLWKIAKA